MSTSMILQLVSRLWNVSVDWYVWRQWRVCDDWDDVRRVDWDDECVRWLNMVKWRINRARYRYIYHLGLIHIMNVSGGVVQLSLRRRPARARGVRFRRALFQNSFSMSSNDFYPRTSLVTQNVNDRLIISIIDAWLRNLFFVLTFDFDHWREGYDLSGSTSFSFDRSGRWCREPVKRRGIRVDDVML